MLRQFPSPHIWKRWLALLCLAALSGCARTWLSGPKTDGVPPGYAKAPENPLFIPACDREFLWEQLIDTLDDYFRIAQEDRVRLVGNIVMEGRVETYPLVGATYLEPWRFDSTYQFERLYATLQSVRRIGHARVMPVAGGYLVEVIVDKELEDLDRPERSTVGAASLRHDGSLVRNESTKLSGSATLGWIPLGRDASLEEKILVHLRGRLTNVEPPH